MSTKTSLPPVSLNRRNLVRKTAFRYSRKSWIDTILPPLLWLCPNHCYRSSLEKAPHGKKLPKADFFDAVTCGVQRESMPIRAAVQKKASYPPFAIYPLVQGLIVDYSLINPPVCLAHASECNPAVACPWWCVSVMVPKPGLDFNAFVGYGALGAGPQSNTSCATV